MFIFLNFIQPLIVDVSKEFIINQSKVIIASFAEKSLGKKQIEKKFTTKLNELSIPNELINNFRIVTNDQLIVRSSSKKNSDIVDLLEKNDVVNVISKNKNWSQIEFRNNSGEFQTGWVNTRYLNKIDK